MVETTLGWIQFEDHIQGLCHSLYENQHYADCILRVRSDFLNKFLYLTSNKNFQAEGKEIRCHKSVLSQSSDYFKHIFNSYTLSESIPTIIIPDINFNCLQSLIYFIYIGEIVGNLKDFNELWDAASLLDIKSIKIVLGGFVNQSQQVSLDENTLNVLVTDLQDTEEISERNDDDLNTKTVDTIQLDLIEAIIPVVTDGLQIEPIMINSGAPCTMRDPQKVVQKFKTKKRSPISGVFPLSMKSVMIHKPCTLTNYKRSLPPLTMLREQALGYQKHLEMAMCACKSGLSLEEVCNLYPSVTKETLYRNVKNFNLPHIRDAD